VLSINITSDINDEQIAAINQLKKIKKLELARLVLSIFATGLACASGAMAICYAAEGVIAFAWSSLGCACVAIPCGIAWLVVKSIKSIKCCAANIPTNSSLYDLERLITQPRERIQEEVTPQRYHTQVHPQASI